MTLRVSGLHWRQTERQHDGEAAQTIGIKISGRVGALRRVSLQLQSEDPTLGQAREQVPRATRLAVGVTLVQLEIATLDVPECCIPPGRRSRRYCLSFDCRVVRESCRFLARGFRRGGAAR